MCFSVDIVSSIRSGFVDHIQLICVSIQLSTIAVYDGGFNFPPITYRCYVLPVIFLVVC